MVKQLDAAGGEAARLDLRRGCASVMTKRRASTSPHRAHAGRDACPSTSPHSTTALMAHACCTTHAAPHASFRCWPRCSGAADAIVCCGSVLLPLCAAELVAG